MKPVPPPISDKLLTTKHWAKNQMGYYH